MKNKKLEKYFYRNCKKKIHKDTQWLMSTDASLVIIESQGNTTMKYYCIFTGMELIFTLLSM